MRNFTKTKKIVIKIGTNTLSKPDSIEIDDAYIKQIAKQVSQLLKKDVKVVIVTSGAIGMGAGYLKMTNVKTAEEKQACAAAGQPLLMEAYKKAFNRYKIKIAQVLLTSHVLDKIETYKNLRCAIDKLLTMNIVPILNENDCVSTEEINMAFGDNDKLSARVASKIDADLLIILSDIDALYDKNPNEDSSAKPIKYVDSITPEILQCAGKSGSKYATGGMKSKIEAVQIAFDSDCRIILAKGRAENVLIKILDGEEIGTIFVPEGVTKLNNRERWIRNSASVGKIDVPDIRKKIKNQEYIFPIDVSNVEGVFNEGAVLTINDQFKAITQLDSDVMKQIMGKTQGKIKKELGKGGLTVLRCEDIVPLRDI